MHSAVVGFPRVGKLRELKFASEKYLMESDWILLRERSHLNL